jgi:ABC-2 type transport system permease protein
MIRCLRAEWTKVRTLPGTYWLLAGAAMAAGFGRTGVLIGQIAIVVFAVRVIGTEYGTGLIRVTLTANPHRISVYASKAVLAAGPAAVTGTVALAGRTQVLYLTMIAVYSLGIAAALRDSAGATVIVLATLFVTPLLARIVTDPDWQRFLTKFSPMTAGPVVLAGYAAVSVVVGAMLFRYRDA